MTERLQRQEAATAADYQSNLHLIEDDGVSSWAGLEQKLKGRIIGQDAAIESIITALDRSRLRDGKRPVASLMFIGPTGVGKTQLAEALADGMTKEGEKPAFLRIDCGEFTHGHELASLVGSPLGFVGDDVDPMFKQDIIERQGSVVLFDEVEKANPKLHDLMLQIMEGGKVALLNKGKSINFSNAMIIMTSNIGSAEMAAKARPFGFPTPSDDTPRAVEAAGHRALRHAFRPEFLNRLDQVVSFRSLDDDELTQVLETHVAAANDRYRELGNVSLRLSAALAQEIVLGAPDRAEYGARPVLRRYERLVEAKLSRMLGKAASLGELYADYDGEVRLYHSSGEAPASLSQQ